MNISSMIVRKTINVSFRSPEEAGQYEEIQHRTLNCVAEKLIPKATTFPHLDTNCFPAEKAYTLFSFEVEQELDAVLEWYKCEDGILNRFCYLEIAEDMVARCSLFSFQILDDRGYGVNKISTE